MRSAGILILVILALLLGGSVLKQLLAGLGTWAGAKALRIRWIYLYLGGGTEESKRRAEQAVGHHMAREMPTDRTSRFSPMLDRVGGRLSAAVPGRVFRFSVLASSELNAFAIPGGYIFITSALAEALASDEAALAFVLGHEMGHVLLEHPAERMTLNLVMSVIHAQMVQELFLKGYSRQQELAADENAVELMREAGYGRSGAERVFSLLARLSTNGGGWLSTHPEPAERLAAIRG